MLIKYPAEACPNMYIIYDPISSSLKQQPINNKPFLFCFRFALFVLCVAIKISLFKLWLLTREEITQ